MKLSTLADTKKLADKLVKQLPEHALLVLVGKLGAGKTTLTQAIADCLGSSATVSSPTYTLIHEYPTDEGLLVHIDAYRLDSPERLLELGLDDYLDRARLVVVEWGEGLNEFYPDAWILNIDINYAESEEILRSVSLKQAERSISLT